MNVELFFWRILTPELISNSYLTLLQIMLFPKHTWQKKIKHTVLIIINGYEAIAKTKTNEISNICTLDKTMVENVLDVISKLAAAKFSSVLHIISSHTHRDVHFEPKVLC